MMTPYDFLVELFFICFLYPPPFFFKALVEIKNDVVAAERELLLFRDLSFSRLKMRAACKRQEALVGSSIILTATIPE